MPVFFDSQNKFRAISSIVGILTLACLVIFFNLIKLSVLQSDPYMYWLQSKEWWKPDLHLPGYSILIWLVNLLSFQALPAIFILHILSFLCWIGSIFSFSKILEKLKLDRDSSNFLFIVYAFFPLLGVTFAAWPLADASIWLFSNLMVLSLIDKRWKEFAICSAAALLLHKVNWGICFFLSLYALRSGISIKNIIISTLPLIAFWLWLVSQGEAANWLIEHDVQRHFPSHSRLPIFDGILGTFQQAGWRSLSKASLLLVVYLLQIYLLVLAFYRRNILAICIILPLLILGALVNQWISIAILRFGKIAVIAAALLIAGGGMPGINFLKARKVQVPLLILLIISQFAYAYYMKAYFKEGGYLEQRLEQEKSVMEDKGLPVYDRGK